MVSSQPSFFKKITYTEGIYPVLTAEAIQNPNRLFAIPLLGILIKAILLIPVGVELFFLFIYGLIVVWLINPWVVLFTGQYWSHAYNFLLGMIRLMTKVSFYFFGLTDKYPWFGFNINDKFTLDIQKPENPKRLYGIPIVGGLIRIVLVIPYIIFEQIVSQAAGIGAYLLAWAVVLFKGRYPAGIFELARDSIRVNVASWAYFSGLSDRYPSFYISMTHDKIKLILLGISIILGAWNLSTNFSGS